ncbi:MAG: hypothetical protein HYR72_20845 [Deltaproteobacteria bacterium]|nr:hypothetical protein [Deltaproteobacteria bacterium]MBI3391027.1 hypothetical protein [Deltaproteobacteria bacterium]
MTELGLQLGDHVDRRFELERIMRSVAEQMIEAPLGADRRCTEHERAGANDDGQSKPSHCRFLLFVGHASVRAFTNFSA